jgi:lipopolysaccharide export system permease protein
MCILDRYILKSVIGLFLISLLVFLFLYIIIDVFSNLNDILKQNISITVLLQYYLSYLPIIFVLVAPISCLLGTLYTFAKLNRFNEIIAMRSSGLSIFQITKTVIIFGVLVSLFVFWIRDKFVPSSMAVNQKIKEEIESNIKKERKNEIINNLTIYGLKNRLFFVNKFILATNTMEGITILEQDEHQNVTKKIVANKGVYKDGLWRFYQVLAYEFNENNQAKQEFQYSEEEIMAIPETPHEFLSQRQQPDFMTIAQLDDYIWKLSKSGATAVIQNLKIDLYQRFTYPLINIVIIFLAIPFALKMKKRATGISSLGVSIMLGFIYYVVDAVSIAFGKAGYLAPIIAASLSHIIFFLLGLYLIYNLP